MHDSQLLLLLQERNEGAFAEIYNRYWKILYSTAYNLLQNEAIAKDAVQEVFISLWQRGPEAAIQHLKPYLQQATRFQVLKAIRTQKADEQFYDRLAEVAIQIIYENPLLIKEQETLFREMLESLPNDCRQVFFMSREQNLTYRQIATELHISEKTVEKRMSACLRYIRQAIEKHKAILTTLFL